MTWRPYQRDVPNQSTNLPLDRVRENLRAQFSSMLLALPAVPTAVIPRGWSYYNSYQRSLVHPVEEPTPGTKTAPTRTYFINYHVGQVNDLIEWVKIVNTYSGGALISAAYYYSDDNQKTYVPMVDQYGNYVLSIQYDAGALASTSWGSNP